jgi:hypothetical protein
MLKEPFLNPGDSQATVFLLFLNIRHVREVFSIVFLVTRDYFLSDFQKQTDWHYV